MRKHRMLLSLVMAGILLFVRRAAKARGTDLSHGK